MVVARANAGSTVDRAQARRPAGPPPSNAEVVYKSVKPLAEDLTLGMLGEDSGTSLTAYYRAKPPGPIKPLTADVVLKSLNYKDPAKAQRYDGFQFHKFKPNDATLWEGMKDNALDEDAAVKLKNLLSGGNVRQLVTMVADDRWKNNFGANAYLIAQMKDGSLLVLRGGIGGMSL